MLKISLVVLLCAVSLTARSADVYVAFDAQGAAHFADKPLDGSYRLLFQDLQSGALAQALPTAEPAPVRAIARARALGPGPAPEIRLALEGAARRHGLDYALLHAVAHTESGFDTLAVSPKGAIGVMQLMPDTARRYGVQADDAAALRSKLHQSAINVEAGGRMLSDLMRRFEGRLELVLAAYNAGEGAVKRAGNRIPDYPETRQYVAKVMQKLDRLQAGAAQALPALAPVSAPVSASTSASTATSATSAKGLWQAAAEPAAATRKPGVQLFRGDAVEIEKFERGFAR